jgi:hypothetical protein
MSFMARRGHGALSQVELPLNSTKKRGGKRPGAGRPRIGRGSAPHRRRPTLTRHTPVHVVLRVVRDIGSLRRRRMYHALRQASIIVAMRELHDRPGNAFRIVHLIFLMSVVYVIVY